MKDSDALVTEYFKEELYPLFYKTCIYLQGTFFYHDIFNLCKEIPVNYVLAEKVCHDAFLMCNSDWSTYTKKLNNLLEINIEFLKLQAHLEKDGRYLYSSFKEVEKNVFEDKIPGELGGVEYHWGLYFSQLFWVTHHRVFNFFIKEFIPTEKTTGKCLDIPVGSGIFLTQFLLAHREWKGVGVDLSDTAIDFARKIFSVNGLTGSIDLIKKDFFEFTSVQKFDRVICVEFIEHVEDPVAVLKKLRSMLADGGTLFLTTVTWAAFIDHIYLYKNVDEIREHIGKSGLGIEREYIQNIFPKDAGKLEESKTALNYAAILVKK